MHDVELSRFVAAPPPVVERALDPAAVVEYEGSFVVRDVAESEDGWLVTAGATGLELTLWFEHHEDGVYYEQRGDDGPLDAMETRLRLASEDEGTRVTAESSVSLGLPLPAVTDRVAAWKRRGELRRALGRLAEDVE